MNSDKEKRGFLTVIEFLDVQIKLLETNSRIHAQCTSIYIVHTHCTNRSLNILLTLNGIGTDIFGMKMHGQLIFASNFEEFGTILLDFPNWPCCIV